MLKKIIGYIFILEIVLIFILINQIDNKPIIVKEKNKYNVTVNKKEMPIGYININKININEEFYNKNSAKNNIEEHVTILKESNYPNLLILAAHSGTGKIAYFEKLNQLNINDLIKIKIYNEEKIYIVNKIWEEQKNGKIHIDKTSNNQLILTTCSPNHKNKQLIISCIEKEST